MEQNDDARAPFLVLAHHRSGSNFLNDLLQSHPCIECINEPLSMHTRFFINCDLVPWSGDDFDPCGLHAGLDGHDTLRAFLSDMRRYLLQSSRWRVVGFKETGLFGKLEWLKAFLPGLKVLFLKRDPRAIVSSVLRSGLTEFWMYPSLVPPVFRDLFPDYASRVDPADSATRAAELAAMSVAARYALAERSIGLFEHQVLDLDEFIQEPARRLDALFGFLGAEPHAQPLSFLAQRQSLSRGGTFSSFRSGEEVRDAWRNRLSPRQIEAVDAVMRAAGGEDRSA